MDLEMILDNAFGALNAAEDQLNYFLKDEDESCEGFAILEDVRKSIDDLHGLFDKIHYALCFATYAGICEATGGYDFAFGTDSWAMRNEYLSWADDVDMDATKEYLYEVLSDVFDKKVEKYKE